MQSSKNRHNFFSKVDHDKSFVETNYSPPKTDSPKTPLASFDVRKKLAASDLSVKLNAKSPVITASSLAVYEDENPFDDSQVQYHDVDSSSVASNHSRELNNVKNALSKKVSDNIHYTAIAFTGSRDLFDEEKIDEALQLNLNTQRTRGYSDMTENNIESDEEDEHLFGESTYLPYDSTTGNRERAQSGNSVHSGINSGMYSTQKPTQFNSTLEVHRSFMRAAEEKDTLKSIQAVGSVKVLGSPALSSSKHLNNSSPSQESVKKFTGSPALQSHKTLSSGSPAQLSHKQLRPMTPVEFGSKKFSGVPAASSGSPSSSPATPFNRKQSGATNSTGAAANQGDTSPDSKAAEGRGLGQSLLSSASKSFMFLSKLSHGTLTPSADNHNSSNISNNNAGKENNSSALTLQVSGQSGSSPQSSPSFTTPQKGSKLQLTPLGSPSQQGLGSHPHNHSGNEMKEMMSMMKQAHHNLAHQNLIREMGATPSEQGDNHSVMSSAALAKHEPLYEVTQLKALHENKANRPVLNLLDKAVAALSFQRKPPSRTPPPPIQPAQLTLKSIFSENELINAGISHETAVDDEEFFKMIRETTKPRTKKRIAMGLGPVKTESRDHQTTKPSADEVVNDIAKYLHNETRASTAGKVTSNSSDYNLYSSPSPTKPPQHNHNSSSASMKQSVAPPLLDFSKVKPNPMTPINGSTVSGGSQSQSQYDSQSQSYSQSQSQQSSAISRLPDILAPKPAQQVPQPLYSGGNYAKALSPATQTYIAGIYGNNTPPGGGSLDRTPVLTRSSTFGEGGEDDDLRDLRLVSQQAHGQSHHSFNHVTQSAETALTIFDQQQPMSARSTRSATSQYKYQHSTTSYVPKEVNQSSFGLYSRHSARPDIEFSERHLAAIHDNTAGNGAPVIYIPTDSTHHVSLAKHQSGNVPPGTAQQSLYKPHGSTHSMHSSSLSGSKLSHNKAAVSFHTGTVVQESNYNGVARQLNYTNSTPNLPHHSASMPQLVKKGDGSAHSSSQMALLNNNYGSPTTHETKSLVPHNDHSHSRYSNYSVSSPDIRTEINDYIQKISSPATVLEEQDDAPYSARSELTHTSNVSEARDQLWYKLHHRYSGDREGVATTQLKVKEYLLEAVVEENHIMRDYMKEMDEGW